MSHEENSIEIVNKEENEIKWPLPLLKYLLPATNYLVTFSGHQGPTTVKQITQSTIILSLMNKQTYSEKETFIIHFEDCKYYVNKDNYETEIYIQANKLFIHYLLSPEEFYQYYREKLNLYPSPTFDASLKIILKDIVTEDVFDSRFTFKKALTLIDQSEDLLDDLHSQILSFKAIKDISAFETLLEKVNAHLKSFNEQFGEV